MTSKRDIYIYTYSGTINRWKIRFLVDERFEVESRISRACGDDNGEQIIDENRDRKRSANSDRESRPSKFRLHFEKYHFPLHPVFHAAGIHNLHKLQKEEGEKNSDIEFQSGVLLIAFHARPRNAIFPPSVNPAAD